jgi:hypothetical protein
MKLVTQAKQRIENLTPDQVARGARKWGRAAG